ncbi:MULTISPECIES: VOC family protein [Streptomyces]|uniref:VOC family protein n=1 Tax=Streptomyces edwardsiae TaxID=3075527 RepID=A0ABU2QUH3_9ACTN|nr:MULTISPECIES: VOC family protein [unclassified Streptomyces]MDT0406740.1 VOC family protein [Streptomyces sp. DSM 41635]
MQITVSTVSLTVDDVNASRAFFTDHLGYQAIAAADGFASLTRGDAAVDIVLLRGAAEDRDDAGFALAFTVTGIEGEERRLRDRGVAITTPLRKEPWGERLFQVTDPSGVVVRFVEWASPLE